MLWLPSEEAALSLGPGDAPRSYSSHDVGCRAGIYLFLCVASGGGRKTTAINTRTLQLFYNSWWLGYGKWGVRIGKDFYNNDKK